MTMQIKSIYVNNFKSLFDFEIDLAKFNCFIGLNGSGKSTFLQFMDFLSQLMKGGIHEWLQKRKWINEDIVSHFDNRIIKTIYFEVQFDCDDKSGSWVSVYSSDDFRCFIEKFTLGDTVLEVLNPPELEVHNLPGRDSASFVVYCAEKVFKHEVSNRQEQVLGKCYVFNKTRTENIHFHYQGSIFSQLADEEIVDAFWDVIRYFRNIHSFSPLSSYFLKQPSQSANGSIGFGGEDLASFLFGLHDSDRAEVIGKIKKIYPEFNSFSAFLHQDRTKQLTINEQYRNGNINYPIPARIANDGILRIIAMLSQLNAKTDFLLFDEIENGINPELVGLLLDELVNAKQQIVVTTHSPLFLNYLEDDLAREAVKYFYKTPEGYTRAIPFFEIPSIQEKLGVLGPGEAFADTNLYKLADEIERITAAKKEE